MALTDVHLKIIRKVCTSKQGDLTSHLVERDLGLPIEEELKDLVQAKFIRLSAPREHGKRFIRITDKGECNALMLLLDLDFDTLAANHPYLEDDASLKEFRKVFKNDATRTEVMRRFASRCISKSLFDKDGAGTIFSSGFKWERREILTDLTHLAVQLHRQDSNSVNLGVWKKYIKRMDGNIKIEGIINPPMTTVQ